MKTEPNVQKKIFNLVKHFADTIYFYTHLPKEPNKLQSWIGKKMLISCSTIRKDITPSINNKTILHSSSVVWILSWQNRSRTVCLSNLRPFELTGDMPWWKQLFMIKATWFRNVTFVVFYHWSMFAFLTGV